MKLKNMLIIASAATLLATGTGKAKEPVTIPPGRTVVEVAPGATVVETPAATVTAPAPQIVVEPAPPLTEPAGAGPNWNMKDRFTYVDESENIYNAQEFSFDLAGAYGVGRDKWNDSFDSTWREDSSGNSGKWGASVGMNYFITRNFGVGVDAWGLDNGSDFVDAASGSVILRLPIDVAHLAPYIFGGGGRTFEGPDSWIAHAGLGLELRLNPHTGIFVDGRHIFFEKDNTDDFALVRAGLRFAF